MKFKKAVTTVEYTLIFLMTAVIFVAVIAKFNPDTFKTLFKYTFEFKNEMGTQVNIGPMSN